MLISENEIYLIYMWFLKISLWIKQERNFMLLWIVSIFHLLATFRFIYICFNIYYLIRTVLYFLKTSFASHKVIKLWLSIVVYHWREGKTVSFIACQMWRQSVEEIQLLVRAQLGKPGPSVGKVQLGRAENGNRPCDCWKLCSRWLGHPPLQSFHSRSLSEIQTCSSVTSGSPVVSVPQFPDPGHLSQWCFTCYNSLWPLCSQWLLGNVPAPVHAVSKMWMTAEECWMYSWGRNRI